MEIPQAEQFVIRPVEEPDSEAILAVYRQCEDFLALGPVPTACLAMVQEDLAHSREMGGVFCGIHVSGKMVGVVDYVPGCFEGEPGVAFLSLLMIAGPYRAAGLGTAVVKAVENIITANRKIREIRSGVQVNNAAGIRFWRKMGYTISGGPELMPDGTTVYHLSKRV